MHEGQLYEGFREVNKLILIFLTIPYSTASVERSFSALKRIRIYLKNAQGQNRLSNLSLMSIEKSLLKRLMSTSVFYDNVITHFCGKRCRVELLFKRIAMLIIVIEVFFSVTSSAHGFSQIIFCLLLTVR